MEFVLEAAKRDITIKTGDTFRLAFRLYTRDPETGVKTYQDLTGYTGRSFMREHQDSEDALAVFTVTIDPDQTANRGLVRVTLSAVDTLSLDSDGVWAVALVSPGGEVTTWVEGAVNVRKGVARV